MVLLCNNLYKSGRYEENMERHVRWNWERSPDDDDMVRYHFVVVDDKDRPGIVRRILEQLQECSSVIPVRTAEGKVKDTEFRYLFESYDAPVAPKMIRWEQVSKRIIKDSDLRERTKGSIENYVASIYS